MRLLLQRSTRLPLVPAMAVSALIHVCGFAALASWALESVAPVWIDGGRTGVPIELVISTLEHDLPITEVRLLESPVLITPTWAQLAGQRFVDTLTEPDPTEISEVALDATLLTRLAISSDKADVDEPSSGPKVEQDDDSRAAATLSAELPASTSPQPVAAGLDVKQPPEFSGNRPPRYPALARQQGLDGTVLLRLSIDDRGHVENVEVARSSGHPILDAAAANAVRTWKGRPATRGGKPVATVELLPVRFRLH